ncbi:hypothetical protein ACROYT_G006318 [Oculina patagonica]
MEGFPLSSEHLSENEADNSLYLHCAVKDPRVIKASGRRGGLIISALDSGSSAPGSSPSLGHCVVGLLGSNPAVDSIPIWWLKVNYIADPAKMDMQLIKMIALIKDYENCVAQTLHQK